MYQNDYGSHPIEVRCPRDPGFVRLCNIEYWLHKNERKLYTRITCKQDGKTETCERCRSAIVMMCNLNGATAPETPLTPDLEVLR